MSSVRHVIWTVGAGVAAAGVLTVAVPTAQLLQTGPAGLLAVLPALLGGRLVFLAAAGRLWQRLLGALGSPLPAGAIHHAFALGMIARYVPTGLLALAGRTALARRHGVPVARCLTSIGYENARSSRPAAAPVSSPPPRCSAT